MSRSENELLMPIEPLRIVWGIKLYGFITKLELKGDTISEALQASGYRLCPPETYCDFGRLAMCLMDGATPRTQYYWDFVDNGYYVPAGTVVLATKA